MANSSKRIVTEDDLKISAPFRKLVGGPSQSGKTVYLKNFIKNLDKIVNFKIHKIVFCYSIFQPIYHDIAQSDSRVIFVEGLPETLHEDYLSPPEMADLVILDDLMTQLSESKFLCDAFTKFSHHYGYSLIITSQNLFYPGKYWRTISLNCSIFVIFRNWRDQRVIKTLAMQMFPSGNGAKNLCLAYEDAVSSSPHAYLFINLLGSCNESLRFRGNVFDNAERPVYIIQGAHSNKAVTQ